MAKTMWRGWVKTILECDFRMCLDLSNYPLKIDCYKHSLVYMKHMVTTNQKSTRDIQEIERKESKYNTIENHQPKRE